MKLFKAGLLSGAILVAVPAFSQTLKDAIRLTDNEQFKKAAASYQKLIQAQPTNGDNYFYYGENYFKNEDLDSAALMYTKGVEMNSTNGINHVGLGKVELMKGNVAKAHEQFFKAKTISSNKNAVIFTKIAEAWILAEPKNVDEAMKELNLAMKLDPKNVETLLILGDAHLENTTDPNSGASAIKQYEKAVELDKKSAKGLLRIGKLWSRARNYSLALDYYKKAIETEPNFAPAYRERAELYFKAGRYSEAVVDYEKYLELNDDPSARMRYAQFLYLAKQYTKSIEEINKIMAKDSSMVVLYRILGYSLYETKDYPAALKSMNSFFEKSSKQGGKILALDYEYLGKLQAEVGQDSLGVLTIEKAIALDSTRKDLYGEIGEIYIKSKKFKEAAESIEKKIAYGKNVDINDYNRLGKAYYTLKEYVKADSAFSQVERLQPKLTYGSLWRGHTNSALDPEAKEGLAKPHYERYIQIALNDVEKNKRDLIRAYEYLGFYYFQAKEMACSKASWLKVKELDPNNAKAKAALDDPAVKGAGECDSLPKAEQL